MCKAPATHSKGPIPETFLGHASGRALHEETGQAAVWVKRCVNRGSLGSASLLTSSLTLVNEGDTITVEAFGTRAANFPSFTIETLSPSATTAEVVHGVEAALQVQIPGEDGHSAPASTFGAETPSSETER